MLIAAVLDDNEQVSGYHDVFPMNKPTTRFYHDGQAGMEEDFTVEGQPGQSAQLTVTRHALGARGTDARYVSVNGAEETSAYPLYDGHGNMVGEVARAASSPWFSLGSQRKYDAWGQVRSGSGPDQGYCANLQHRRDAESGLVYMRARYYEPWTGRFLSEDPAKDGANWYAYCANDPVNLFDPDGREVATATAVNLYIIGSGLVNMLFTCLLNNDWNWQTMLRGFTVGAVTAAGTLFGPVGGAIAGSLAGMADAWLTGGNILAGGILGGLGGGLGGVLSVQAAVAERQYLLYALLSFDVGGMTATAGAYSQLLGQ
ncbi:MAG: RHS repeat-associated core domain-containing protein [Fimbriimonadaceae bacterium]|nr:RHS repeat-associated core domain-containing protein [Fimbriimonadaceae bacterium]QYK58957.1 MAG: RHS repeat-associated core domain-containing protein [Fimbriimonadaceae bacterium]